MNKKNILGVTIAVVMVILVYLILKSRKKSPILANGQGENLTSSDFAGGGGNLGQAGQNAGGTAGGAGAGIDGWSYRIAQSGNNDGDIRGGTIN